VTAPAPASPANTRRPTPRIAVLGLYNSGSSCLAGCLHHLGVDMGAPYWGSCFEPYDLAAVLRRVWNEPQGRSDLDPANRVQLLRHWMLGREAAASTSTLAVGAKHPLLALAPDDIGQAWGPDVKYLWAHRDLDESIARLHRRGWFGSDEAREGIQRKLWAGVSAFADARPDLLTVRFDDLRADPAGQIDAVSAFLGLAPTLAQRAAAERSVAVTTG
jgi:hypothetical protein